MTISQALSNAASGLSVVGRASSVIANNVANAMTEGYARRETEISIGAGGSGATVVSVVRATDAALTGDRRIAEASAADAETRADFLLRVEEAIGSSDDEGSLTSRVSAMEAALVSASSMPQSESRLDAVVSSAQSLAEKIASISDDIQSARTDADAAIARDVAKLNDTLAKIDDLNKLIFTQTAAGRDVNDLLDRRQQLVDDIAAIIPIREVAREGGKIALQTVGGLTLLDGRVATLAFTASPAVDASMSLGAPLSGLTIDGKAVASSTNSWIAGGSLAAQFAIRDELAVQTQSDLDSLARNLIERFSSADTDPTLTGEQGLFVALDSADAGVAGRIGINPIVVPSEGGDLTALRDGLYATAAAEAGDASALIRLSQALSKAMPSSEGETGFLGSSAALLSSIATRRQSADETSSFRLARADALTASELSQGVNTDDEMQKLLLVEAAYAANARVLSAVDEMLRQLLEI